MQTAFDVGTPVRVMRGNDIEMYGHVVKVEGGMRVVLTPGGTRVETGFVWVRPIVTEEHKSKLAGFMEHAELVGKFKTLLATYREQVLADPKEEKPSAYGELIRLFSDCVPCPSVIAGDLDMLTLFGNGKKLVVRNPAPDASAPSVPSPYSVVTMPPANTIPQHTCLLDKKSSISACRYQHPCAAAQYCDLCGGQLT